MNSNKGNYADEIDTKLCRLKLITGTLEMEYAKPRDDSQASKDYINTLDGFALGLSSILTETMLKMTNSWPIKSKDVTVETLPLYYTMVVSMESIGEFARMIQPEK